MAVESGPVAKRPITELVEAPRRATRRHKIAVVEHGIRSAWNWSPTAGVVIATRYASIVLLLAAIGILVWGLVSALIFTSANTGIPCTDPPKQVSTPPQLVVVLVCIVGFVLGHMTARLQPVDPKMLYVPEGQARAKAKHVAAEIGTEEAADVADAAVSYKDPAAEKNGLYHRRNEALVIQALLLLFLLEVAALLTIEAVTLQTGVWPITYYVRCAYDAAGNQSMLAAAAILFLVGRWFWLPARGDNAASQSH